MAASDGATSLGIVASSVPEVSTSGMSRSEHKSNTTRVILAGLIGNFMEWYDFAVYGYLATVIGKQFFPSENPTVSLIAAFGAFAAGFLVRPLGGLVLVALVMCWGASMQ